MRVFGAILVCFGLLLCLTIFLAPFGFFLIFVGLICVVLGGRRRTVINNVVQVSTTPGQSYMQANLPDLEDQRGPTRRIEPPRFVDHTDADRVAARPVIDVTPAPPQNQNGFSYDKAKWDALVRYDSDISRLVDVLAPYGQKYVDELAAGYLALNDKNYLPMIIQKIVATAKQDQARAAAR